MSIHLGAAARGTYRVESPVIPNCRKYHYEFVDGSGVNFRYPAKGELLIGDECASDYLSPTSRCAVDFDASGIVDSADIFSFLSHWFVGDLRTDFDESGVVDQQDIFAFLNAWLIGCP